MDYLLKKITFKLADNLHTYRKLKLFVRMVQKGMSERVKYIQRLVTLVLNLQWKAGVESTPNNFILPLLDNLELGVNEIASSPGEEAESDITSTSDNKGADSAEEEATGESLEEVGCDWHA